MSFLTTRDDADTGGRVVAQLVDLVQSVQELGTLAQHFGSGEERADQPSPEAWASAVQRLVKAVESNKPSVKVINKPVPGIDKVLTVLADTFENAILPLVKNMDKKLDIDLRTHDKMTDISNRLRELRFETVERSESDPQP
jgi:hypothetical protein